MKKVFLGLALCAFAFVACDETNNDNGGNGDNGGENTSAIVNNTISGTLKHVVSDNYDGRHFGGDVTNEIDEVRGFVYNEGTDVLVGSALVSNGRFSIKLEIPKSVDLGNITDEMPESLTISDVNAKWVDGSLEGFKNGYSEYTIDMYSANLSEEMYFFLTYVDRDVTIEGSFVVVENSPNGRGHDGSTEFEKRNTKSEDDITINVNMNLKKGWNVIEQRKVDANNGTMTTNNTFTNIVWGIWDYEYPTNGEVVPNEKKEESFGKSIRTKGLKTIWSNSVR